MIENLGFNLTQYKSLRQLQLQYEKLRNENQNLHSQINILTQNYQQKCQALIDIKRQNLQQKVKFKNKNLKYKKLYRQLVDHIQSNLACLKPNQKDQQILNSSINDKSIFVHLQETQNLEKICLKLSNMTKQFLSLKDKNTHISRKMEQFETQHKSETLEKQKTQKMIVKQIHHLESQLYELNNNNMQLEAKLNLKEKEKRKIDSQLKKLKVECKELEYKVNQLNKQKQQKDQEDTEFALDFMTFQLQTLQTFFNRVTDSTKFSSEISNLMMIIYADYEQISEVFRQKLQIEYDLQELQQRYKSQKVSTQADQNLLIETRRQIETFRLQLLKQKQIFRQKQQFIEEHFEQYLKVNESQLKVKNYSYEVENKLYRQKRSQIQTTENNLTGNNTARNILAKRTQLNKDFVKDDPDEQQLQKQQIMPQKRTSVRFKQTNNAQEIMREIIKKDKNNLQKILKQTRRTSIPIYMNK